MFSFLWLLFQSIALIGAIASFALPLGAEADHGHDHEHGHAPAAASARREAFAHADHEHAVRAAFAPRTALVAGLVRRLLA